MASLDNTAKSINKKVASPRLPRKKSPDLQVKPDESLKNAKSPTKSPNINISSDKKTTPDPKIAPTKLGSSPASRVAKAKKTKGSTNVIFGAVGALVISIGFIVYLATSKPAHLTKSESSTSTEEGQPTKKNSGNDDAWGKSYENNPVKIYKDLASAPKGITLYQDRATGNYYDVRKVNEMVRTRYTKNINDYREVKN